MFQLGLGEKVRCTVIQRKPYMLLQLRLDQESFNELKELLRTQSRAYRTVELSPSERQYRDALNRVFSQVRDVEYRGA